MPSLAPSLTIHKASLTLQGPEGKLPILKDIDLQLNRGEVLSVVGPSGSGKTSLLMLIAGLEPATDGRIEIAGQNICDMNEDQLAQFRSQHMGIVFQNFHLVPTMSALENVALPLELMGHRDAFERAEACLAQVQLGKRLHHLPAQLSGGEQQRVGLARALVARPTLLLADEPTGNLDGETGQQIADLLFALSREQGTSLLLITHDTGLAARCDRQVIMQAGRLSQTAGA